MGIKFILLFGRQGQLRLHKWYISLTEKEKKKTVADVTRLVLARHPHTTNIIDWKNYTIVYKRYATLFICIAVEGENELLCLELTYRYVELLDTYFGSVCELDIIFNFEKANYIMDELVTAGEIAESGRTPVLDIVGEQDYLANDVELKKILEEIGLY